MDRWMDGQMIEWMDGWTDGQTIGGMIGWVGGWIDRWIKIIIIINTYSVPNKCQNFSPKFSL